MEQSALFHEDIYDAIRAVIVVAGGYKKVDPLLRPTKEDDAAANWLRDCLNPDRREKLDPDDMAVLRKLGRTVGCHAIINFEAMKANYGAPPPLDNEQQAKRLVDALEQLQANQEQTFRRLADLLAEQPGLLRAVVR